jgi:hypothetical protein
MKNDMDTLSLAVTKAQKAAWKAMKKELKDFLFEAFTAYKQDQYDNECYKLFKEMIA